MKNYKLKSGKHVDAYGKAYPTGSLVPSSSDLVALFGADKFELVGEVANPTKQENTSEEGELGEDVTDKFPSAEDKEVTVYYTADKKYLVVDEDGEIFNETEDLTSKKAVTEYIAGL